MNDAWILGNGALAVSLPEGPVLADGALAVRGNTIVAVGERQQLLADHPGAPFVDAGGGLIAPGLVNLHHHFYSALARGLDPGRDIRDFDGVLEHLWWRLDRALGPQEIHLSALVSLVECIRWGVTTVFDHHASPSCIEGSLDTIARAVQQAGLRAVLCYEVSDRNGHENARAGLEESLGFCRRRRHDPKVRGMLGLHASFSIEDETLDEAVQRRPHHAGCHIHLAEDRLDVERSRELYHRAPLARLLDRGLVDERALLIHGVHLDRHEIDTIAASRATVVHNPESNQNNAVGRFDLLAAHRAGCSVGLGTDGMSSAVLPALRSAFLGLRGGHGDPTLGFQEIPPMLAANREFARRMLDSPLLGALHIGAPADIAVFDCPSPTPLTTGNLAGHLLYAVSQAPARHTICDGSFLLRDYQFVTLAPQEIAREARTCTPHLWRRFRGL